MTSTAHAYLGGFEDDDGYTNDYFAAGGPFGLGAGNYLVNGYNAGTYGLANGGLGGSPQHIASNTGLWQVLDGASMGGNRYVLAHAQIGGEISFTGDAMLGLRNQGGSATALEIRYWTDTRDFNGLAPSATAGRQLDWTLRLCPDSPTAGGSPQSPSFYWTFRDANLDAGLLLGWNDLNQFIYRLPSDSVWTVTSFTLDHFNYDQMHLHFDLGAKTWNMSIFDQSAQITIPLVLNSGLDALMDDLSALDWRLEYNQSKSYFDNSVFTVAVPEPGAGLMLVSACVIGLRRRRQTFR